MEFGAEAQIERIWNIIPDKPWICLDLSFNARINKNELELWIRLTCIDVKKCFKLARIRADKIPNWKLLKGFPFCILWDIKGVLYYEPLEVGQTIAADRYNSREIRIFEW